MDFPKPPSLKTKAKQSGCGSNGTQNGSVAPKNGKDSNLRSGGLVLTHTQNGLALKDSGKTTTCSIHVNGNPCLPVF